MQIILTDSSLNVLIKSMEHVPHNSDVHELRRGLKFLLKKVIPGEPLYTNLTAPHALILWTALSTAIDIKMFKIATEEVEAIELSVRIARQLDRVNDTLLSSPSDLRRPNELPESQ